MPPHLKLKQAAQGTRRETKILLVFSTLLVNEPNTLKNVFKILYLVILGWVLAQVNPYGGPGMMKQGVFKVCPF